MKTKPDLVGASLCGLFALVIYGVVLLCCDYLAIPRWISVVVSMGLGSMAGYAITKRIVDLYTFWRMRRLMAQRRNWPEE